MAKKKFFLQKFLFSFLLFFLPDAFFPQNYYWESPVRISSAQSCFPRAVYNGKNAACFWQEVDSAKSEIYLCAAFCIGTTWTAPKRFAGPFPYSGEVPDLYSAAMNEGGVVCVAVLSDAQTVSVFTTDDFKKEFSEKKFSRQNIPLVAPRVYKLQNGGFIIWTSLGRDESFTMLSARSPDGFSWNDFSEFSPAEEMLNPFLPVLLSYEKTDFVVFQAQYRTASRIVYRLYSTKSVNGGASWSKPRLILTGSADDSSHDQRPTLCRFDGKTFMAWERTPYNSENSSIYFAQLNPETGDLYDRAEQVSFSGNASRPILFSYNNNLGLVWFDTRAGAERVYFSERQGFLWGSQQALSAAGTSSLFAFPVITGGGKSLSFVWQTSSSRASYIYKIESDHTVLPPTIQALSFLPGQRSRAERAQFRVLLPSDSSGIRGYSWIWTQDPAEEPPEKLMALPNQRDLSVNATAEKEWFFKARVTDYAGNWSESKTLSYYRDLTPPLPPLIEGPLLDGAGFVNENAFSIKWADASGDEEVSGYSFRLQEQAGLPQKLFSSRRHKSRLSIFEQEAELGRYKEKNPPDGYRPRAPSATAQTKKTQTHFSNLKNGVYTFSVRSFDSAGNRSEPSFITLYVNKFEPFTKVDSVKKSSDIFGESALEIDGEGFLTDGKISSITIFRQGSEGPFSLLFKLSDGDYHIQSDKKISGIKFGNTVPEGTYSMRLWHTDRGSYLVGKAFTVQQNGTVKIAKEFSYTAPWKRVYDTGKIYVQAGDALLAVILIFALCAVVFAARGIALSSREAALVKNEVQALLKGGVMPLEKKKRQLVLKKKAGSLKGKLISFTAILVLMVSLLVSLPLGFIMTRTQERTLSGGLQERVGVLLSSISSGVRAYMPTLNVLELSALPSQSSAMAEANFVTVTGLSEDSDSERLDFVWASNDSNLSEKIVPQNFVPGVSELSDDVMKKISSICSQLNERAFSEVGSIAKNIADLNAEGARLALKSDAVSRARSEEIQVDATELTARLNETLSAIAEENMGSFPEYNGARLDRDNTEYLFYRPVLYRMGSSKVYVRAIVFISVSTLSLIQDIDSARRTIIYISLFVAFFAVLVGTVGAWILASIIVSPIKHLASHVVMIGNTADKEKLAGKEIVIKSRDEIGQLGDSVNEMTRELVKAAQDEHLAMDGKVVQRAFLPLTPDAHGNKQTVAILNDPKFQCFGYYEGASEVSGDYFDYKKLDENHYVMIKCDASGHGVPAALIMTVVATIFRKYYENWSFKKNGVALDSLVTQINDFIESLGIKGKFATLILALIDTSTGLVHLCNAGDNIVHIYDSASKKEKTLTLQETPAAGPLPTFMVQMKGGFKIEQTRLNKGDVLFLYTDGIEESTRHFRNQNFLPINCEEISGVKDGVHENHKVGTGTEQMENDRIQKIIEAVLNKKKYSLKKYHNPIPNETLEFDFTGCNGTTEDAILALCSVEKVFRLYKPLDATSRDTVRVDKRIDAFLKAHFNRYDFYCSSVSGASDDAYVYYEGVREDEQLDDLTLVAARIL